VKGQSHSETMHFSGAGTSIDGSTSKNILLGFSLFKVIRHLSIE